MLEAAEAVVDDVSEAAEAVVDDVMTPASEPDDDRSPGATTPTSESEAHDPKDGAAAPGVEEPPEEDDDADADAAPENDDAADADAAPEPSDAPETADADDPNNAVLSGSVTEAGDMVGRWGFGRGAATTSPFRYAPAAGGGRLADGPFAGSFDLATPSGPRTVEESAAFGFAPDGPRIAISATGANAFGAFSMAGSCAADGSDLLLVRKYDPPKKKTPKRKKKMTVKRNRKPAAAAPAKRVRTRSPRPPAAPSTAGKFGGKEPRRDPESGGPASPSRNRAAPATRGGHRGAAGESTDAGRPLAQVFDAAKRVRDEGGAVSRAPSVTRAEARALVAGLVAPAPLDPDWVAENFKPEEPKQKKGSKQKKGAAVRETRAFGGFNGAEAATSLVSELEYERCLRLFQEAFDRGNLSRLWPVAHAALDDALQRVRPAHEEPQIVRLCVDARPGEKLDDGLRASRVPPRKPPPRRAAKKGDEDEEKKPPPRRAAPAKRPRGASSCRPPPSQALALDSLERVRGLRGEIEPTNPGAYHVNTIAGGFGIKSFDGLDALVAGGGAVAETARCVALDTRVANGGKLQKYCDALASVAGMHEICPAHDGWRFGPMGDTLAGDEDRRHYLIVGWEGGLTPTHCDFGVQAVLYHTLSGLNRVLGVPREVAVVLHAMRESLVNNGLGWSRDCDARLVAFEASALHECLARGALQYDEFRAGESMLIMPRGGHAVLTGAPNKVVLAGEWHLLPDGSRALALPDAMLQRKVKTRGAAAEPAPAKPLGRPFAERAAEEPAPSDDGLAGESATKSETSEDLAEPALAEIAPDCDAAIRLARNGARRVEFEGADAGAVVVAAAGLREVSGDCDLVAHARPDWSQHRWTTLPEWDRIALEADVAVARAAEARAVVVSPLCVRELPGPPGSGSYVGLDEELVARLVAIARPTRVFLGAVALDALLAEDRCFPEIAGDDRADAVFRRLAQLGVAGAYARRAAAPLYARDGFRSADVAELQALAAAAKRRHVALAAAPRRANKGPALATPDKARLSLVSSLDALVSPAAS